jgi:hypothetical protein
MKTVITGTTQSSLDKSKQDFDPDLKDKTEGAPIHHETIPGEDTNTAAQRQKRTVDDDGAAISTTDEDLN